MGMKSYKYRLYPTSEQQEKLKWTLARCCEVYNACLQERRDTWNNIKRHPNYYDPAWRQQAAKEHSISLYDQQNQLSVMKQERTEYLNLPASHILNDVCKRVDLAFKGFFARVKQGKTPGYPRFRPSQRYDSFTLPDRSGWKIEGKRLSLRNIGDIKVKLHRDLEGTPKTCQVKREGRHWYMVVACEVEAARCLPYTDDAIGIDLGLYHFAALSTGDTLENPRYYRKAEKQLKQAQEALSRKKRKDERTGCKGNRRKKAVQKVAKAHRKVRNQRNDFLHKQARQLVNTYETIVFEKLAPANLSRRPKPKQDEETGQYLPNGASAKAGLNKSINDAGWTTFIAMCQYKAESAGTVQVIQVDPKYTSQICSGCGQVKKKTLDERWHSCECGTELDRDVNAALNILALGLKQREATSPVS